MYELRSDPARRLVRVTLSGFMTMDEARSFAHDEQALIAEMGWRSGDYVILADITGCIIQAQDVVAAFGKLVAESPHQARRIAMVTGDSLVRMQARRIVRGDQCAVFASEEEAEAWLFEIPSLFRRRPQPIPSGGTALPERRAG